MSASWEPPGNPIWGTAAVASNGIGMVLSNSRAHTAGPSDETGILEYPRNCGFLLKLRCRRLIVNLLEFTFPGLGVERLAERLLPDPDPYGSRFLGWAVFLRLQGGPLYGKQASAKHPGFVSQYGPERQVCHHDLPSEWGQTYWPNPFIR